MSLKLKFKAYRTECVYVCKGLFPPAVARSSVLYRPAGSTAIPEQHVSSVTNRNLVPGACFLDVYCLFYRNTPEHTGKHPPLHTERCVICSLIHLNFLNVYTSSSLDLTPPPSKEMVHLRKAFSKQTITQSLTEYKPNRGLERGVISHRFRCGRKRRQRVQGRVGGWVWGGLSSSTPVTTCQTNKRKKKKTATEMEVVW